MENAQCTHCAYIVMFDVDSFFKLVLIKKIQKKTDSRLD